MTTNSGIFQDKQNVLYWMDMAVSVVSCLKHLIVRSNNSSRDYTNNKTLLKLFIDWLGQLHVYIFSWKIENLYPSPQSCSIKEVIKI